MSSDVGVIVRVTEKNTIILSRGKKQSKAGMGCRYESFLVLICSRHLESSTNAPTLLRTPGAGVKC